MESDDILSEQLKYYDARAQEYDESVKRQGRFAQYETNPAEEAEWNALTAVLRGLGPVEHALELACGTGLWTAELASVARRVTAVDGSAAMLNTNRAKLGGHPHVEYRQADLFRWTPDEPADLVFFAFFLSHVPPDKLDGFLDSAGAAVKSGGRLMIVDEPAGGRESSGPIEDGQYQTRELHDGRQFRIVKVYYDPAIIQARLHKRGFREFSYYAGEHFFGLVAQK